MSEPKKRKRTKDARKGDRHARGSHARQGDRRVTIVCKNVAEKERWERHVAQSETTCGETFQCVLDAAGVER